MKKHYWVYPVIIGLAIFSFIEFSQAQKLKRELKTTNLSLEDANDRIENLKQKIEDTESSQEDCETLKSEFEDKMSDLESYASSLGSSIRSLLSDVSFSDCEDIWEIESSASRVQRDFNDLEAEIDY